MNANENPTGPAPENNEEQARQRRERSGLNKAEVRELNVAEDILAVAQKPERQAKMEEFDITPELLTAVGDAIKTARKHGSHATQSDSGREGATIDEAEATQDLVKMMRCVQAAAKRKYARTEPERLDEFAVGKPIARSRELLEEFSAQMLERLTSDRPAGINTEFVTKLAAARLQYMAADAAQGAKKSAASSAREARRNLVQTIKDRRLEIQYAADAAWPPGETGHAAIRREFGLPPYRFLSTRRRKAA